MLKFRDYSIARKLTLMSVLVSSAAIALACAAFVSYDVVRFRENVASNLSSQAEIIGANTVSAVLFDDPAAAQQTLAPLSSAPTIVYAGIYRMDGTPFASYSRRQRGTPLPLPSMPEGNVSWFEAGEISLVRTIMFEGKPVEIVYVRASTELLNQRLRRYALITVLVLAGAFIASLLVSAVFRRAVAEPIARLAALANVVSRDKRYSVRATPSDTHDEVSVLIHAFNDMLAQIQQRDSALQQGRDELEARVKERTAELQAAGQQLRVLSVHLLEMQDEERRRLARELHDSTGQILVGLSLNLGVLSAEADKVSPAGRKALNASLNLAQEVTKELRTMSYLLHPPLLDEAGLDSALRWFIDGFSERSNIPVTLTLAREVGRLPRELETAIFRVVQECLTNVHRHSGSPSAEILITRQASEIRMEVRDHGKGMLADQRSGVANGHKTGVGIQGMRERVKRLGGTLEIQSGEDGTTVVAVFPESPTESLATPDELPPEALRSQ